MGDWFTEFIVTLLRSWPILAVWLAALLIALLLWRRHRKVSLVVLITVSVFLLTSAANAYLFARLPDYFAKKEQQERLDSRASLARRQQVYTKIAQVRSYIFALAWAGLIYAVFASRRPIDGQLPVAAQQVTPTSADAIVDPVGARQSSILSTEPYPRRTELSEDLSRKVGDLANEFENAWKDGGEPQLTHFLQRWTDDIGKGELFENLLRIECHARSDRDQELTAAQCLARFPEWAREIALVFGKAESSRTSSRQESSDAESDSASVRYRVLRRHAKGGLGEVYVAHDEELHREVALKEIQERFADNFESQDRFLREAEITGRLEHPGIVPVYGLGRYSDGRPYYAMRFIRGDNLKRAVDRFHGDKSVAADTHHRSLELRKLLGRMIDVCNAVEFAHSRGVVHRDLKPGNVMLGKYGETLVVDWGLAKPVGREGHTADDEPTLRPEAGAESSATQMGSAVGTPAYMSPEQAAGNLDQLGPASDVYSLGATLYYLLTGSAPYSGSSVAAVLDKVKQGDFRAPRSVRSWVHPALNAICLKAMSQDRSDRYSTPTAMVDDIEKWLADEEVSCYRDPLRVAMARSVRRHTILTTASLAGLVAAVITVAVVLSIQLPRELKRRSDVFQDQASQQLDAMQRQTQGDIPNLTRSVLLVGTPLIEDSSAEIQRAMEQTLAVQERLVSQQPDVVQLRVDLQGFYRTLAWRQSRTGELQKSLESYSEAINCGARLVKENPHAFSYADALAASRADLAWVLATCPDSVGKRDGERALQHAQLACRHTNHQEWEYLDTLAACFASQGDYEQARSTAMEAESLAPVDGKAKVRERLELYRKGRAYIEPADSFPSKFHR